MENGDLWRCDIHCLQLVTWEQREMLSTFGQLSIQQHRCLGLQQKLEFVVYIITIANCVLCLKRSICFHSSH